MALAVFDGKPIRTAATRRVVRSGSGAAVRPVSGRRGDFRQRFHPIEWWKAVAPSADVVGGSGYLRLVPSDEQKFERLAEVAPGVDLGRLLAGVEPARVPNQSAVDVLRAEYRQLAHQQARTMAAMVQVGRSVPPDELDDEDPRVYRSKRPVPSAVGEIGTALRLTARSAQRELDLAEQLVHALPLVFAALGDGLIDRGKAYVFADYLDPERLSAGQIETICARLLPQAPGWTTSQLAHRLHREVIAIDPDRARRRYEQAVRDRKVVAYLDERGTVIVSATGLPVGEATAACDRLERLARAVKRAGHPDPLPRIQADLFVGLLDGRWHGLTEAAITADLLSRAGTPDPTPEPESASAMTPEPAPAPEPNAEPGSRQGVEIRVRLSTLLGLDEHPAEIPAHGPVLAHEARKLVAAQRRGAEWRFAVVDHEGRLLFGGATRCRPRRGEGEAGHCRGGVVEVSVSVGLLDALVANPMLTGPWGGVVADIAAQYECREQSLAALDLHPTDRFARARLARHIQLRDRRCSFPGCRRPARKCALDHTQDHSDGGPSTSWNLGPVCDHHHLLFKHTLGWQLHQPEPGIFRWRSPLKQTYFTRGEPIAPDLPDPQPAEPEPDCGDSTTSYDHIEHKILRLPPPEAKPQPPPPGEALPNEITDDEPPF